MRIAITGSSGFIGTHLKRRLTSENFNIIEIDIENGIDLLNWQSLKKLPDFDYLIHLAAKIFVPDSYNQSLDFYHTNITGTLHALELCKQKGAKMIFFSSYVYGHPQYLPIDEEHPLNAFNPYADTKIKGENLCRSYNQFFNVPVTVFRPFNIYGKGQNQNFLIPKIISALNNKQNVTLGDSSPKRDYIYISDVTESVICCIKKQLDGFHTFNLGSGKSYSVKNVVKIIQDLSQSKEFVKFTEEKRINEIQDTVANISRAKEFLNWFPKISLEEGLAKILSQ